MRVVGFIVAYWVLGLSALHAGNGQWHATGDGERLTVEAGGCRFELLENTSLFVPEVGPPRLNYGIVYVFARSDRARLATTGGVLSFSRSAVAWLLTPPGKPLTEFRLIGGKARNNLCYQTDIRPGETIWRLGCPPREIPRAARHPTWDAE